MELTDFRPEKCTQNSAENRVPEWCIFDFWPGSPQKFLNLRYESCLESKCSRRVVGSYHACTGKAPRVRGQKIEGFYIFLAPQVDPTSNSPSVGLPLVALVVSQVHISGFRLALICCFITVKFVAQLKLVSEIYLF